MFGFNKFNYWFVWIICIVFKKMLNMIYKNWYFIVVYLFIVFFYYSKYNYYLKNVLILDILKVKCKYLVNIFVFKIL